MKGLLGSGFPNGLTKISEGAAGSSDEAIKGTAERNKRIKVLMKADIGILRAELADLFNVKDKETS